MKAKKIVALILAALLCAALCLPASAEAAPGQWQEAQVVFTVPEEFLYTLTPDTPAGDPVWVMAKVPDVSSAIKQYEDAGAKADFRTEDGFSVKLIRKESDTTKSIFTLADLSREDLETFVNELVKSQTDDITVTNGLFTVSDQPFFRIDIEGKLEDGTSVREILTGTLINGYSLWFDAYSTSGISPEQEALMMSMVESVRFTERLPKPEPDPVNLTLMLVMLCVLVLVIVVPLVYVPLRSKKDKKDKAAMADRLAEFRQEHPGDSLEGAALFVNSTDCTKEAIRTFSNYHAYIKNLPSLLISGVMCLVVLGMSFLLDMTWWLKIAALAVTVYFAYRTINTPRTIEKIQQKVFQRGVSQTARYTFYNDGFRVSGVQAASTYAYFQITDVRRHGQYLYLYYGPDNIYPVDQYGFTLGEFEDFRKFIAEKTRPER